jgi:light-regulated signal transduction histidine kinase (bacteriophytochrome)
VAAGDDDLRTRIANLERFAHRLTHELGTPLTIARGFATILLGRDDLTPEVRDAVVRIERATATAEARLHARLGEAVGEGPRPVRLRAVLRDVASALGGSAGAVTIEVPDELRVFGEPSVVRQIAGHLLTVLAERARDETDRTTVRVTSVDGPDDAETLRFEVDAPPLTRDEERLIGATDRPSGAAEPAPGPGIERLRAASRMVAGQGGKLWLSDPTSTHDRLALLVQLQRVVDGPPAAQHGPSEG